MVLLYLLVLVGARRSAVPHPRLLIALRLLSSQCRQAITPPPTVPASVPPHRPSIWRRRHSNAEAPDLSILPSSPLS